MTLSTYAFVIFCASFAEASDSDDVTLLQATVQAKIAKLAVNDVPLELDEEILPAEPFQCASEQAPATTLMETPGDSFPVLVNSPSVRVAVVEESPGPQLLKLLLGGMAVLLIVDGLRRCYFRKKHGDKHGNDGEDLSLDVWAVMISAAKSGDLARFQTALKSSEASMNHTDTWGCSPLHFAAVGGSADIAMSLLERRADVNACDALDETPLHFAARADHDSICEVLLDARAAIDAVNVEGLTPLAVAGHANSKKACKILADRGAGVAGLADAELPLLLVTQLIEKTFSTGQQGGTTCDAGRMQH